MTDVPKATDGGCDGETTSGKARSTKDLPGSKSNPYMLRHGLISFSYEGDRYLSSIQVESALDDKVSSDGSTLVGCRVWNTAHFIHPQHGSLLEAWMSMSDRERERVDQLFPRLSNAIFLAVKGTMPKQATCDAKSTNGSLCDRKGTHDVHMGPSGHVLDGMETTEVWT